MSTLTSLRPAPLYARLADTLEELIKAQALRPGDRMPSVRQFSHQQRVSIPTAMQAYAALETRGLVEARPKSGFYVRARQAEALRLPSVTAQRPALTDFAHLDPLDAMLGEHTIRTLVPLGAALPDPRLMPGDKLAREMSAIARRMGPDSVNYDVAPGSPALRRELARRSLDWGCSLKPDDFTVTNGCTEAVALALRATCEPGDTVAVESPTYFGLARVVRELGLKALPIPVDNQRGLDLEALEKALRRTRIRACALIPNFHNPVGCLMPEDRKRVLLELLGRREIPVIEDDIYGDLPHHGSRPRCLKAFDKQGLVLLCGSFSKTLAPGYRTGYIAAGRWHTQVLRLKQTNSLGNATLPTAVIAEYLHNGGYDRYLRHFRETLRQQVERMREAVAESFPSGIGLSQPAGSFVLWCELPSHVNSLEMFHRAREAGISIAPGPLFSAAGGFQNFIRINCGYPMDAASERAVAMLGRIAHQLTARK